MNDAPKVDVKQKKPYTKPEVKQVPLRPEEAVLGLGCKTSSGTGADGPCTPNTCNQYGS